MRPLRLMYPFLLAVAASACESPTAPPPPAQKPTVPSPEKAAPPAKTAQVTIPRCWIHRTRADGVIPASPHVTVTRGKGPWNSALAGHSSALAYCLAPVLGKLDATRKANLEFTIEAGKLSAPPTLPALDGVPEVAAAQDCLVHLLEDLALPDIKKESVKAALELQPKPGPDLAQLTHDALDAQLPALSACFANRPAPKARVIATLVLGPTATVLLDGLGQEADRCLTDAMASAKLPKQDQPTAVDCTVTIDGTGAPDVTGTPIVEVSKDLLVVGGQTVASVSDLAKVLPTRGVGSRVVVRVQGSTPMARGHEVREALRVAGYDRIVWEVASANGAWTPLNNLEPALPADVAQDPYPDLLVAVHADSIGAICDRRISQPMKSVDELRPFIERCLASPVFHDVTTIDLWGDGVDYRRLGEVAGALHQLVPNVRILDGSPGIAGTPRLQRGGAFASLIGDEVRDPSGTGGLMGSEMGDASSLGIGGFGSGGGGTGVGTIGLGNYGTLGHGTGTGDGYGYGRGRGVRGKTPTTKGGTPAAGAGEIDKTVLRKTVQRRAPKVQYCYEKGLLRKPDLEGTVRVSFVIDANGVVTSATATGLGDEEVESCIADAIRSLSFPKPEGGGEVRVTYPFNLKKQ